MPLDPATCSTLLVYGGSFDPPHRAHIALPHAAAEQIGPLPGAGILYIPAGQPPHKSRPMTAAHHRLAMLRLALEDSDRAAISEIELNRAGPSYTVDTLRQLHSQFPGATLRLLIGADMAAIFYQWRDPQAILELAEPLVMMRAPADNESLLAMLPPGEAEAWRSRIVAVPPLDISSTELRTLLAAGDYQNPRLSAMLDAKVIQYIRVHHLYSAVV